MNEYTVADNSHPSSHELSEEEMAAIDGAVELLLQESQSPGCALAIIRDGQTVCTKGYGLRDVERALPVTAETLFPIGSCTKAFTSMAAVMSQDDGLLSLDDHPRKYLPYFSLRDLEADSGVQIRDLLCHRTGLMAHAGNAYMFSGELTRQEMIEALCSAQPTAKLREKLQYNNIMYAAAGEIVARANNMSWDETVSRRILVPLRMHQTLTNIEMMPAEPNFATGYLSEGGHCALAAVGLPNQKAIAPAGSMASNVLDMSHWITFMIDNGVWEGHKLVSENGYEELTKGHIKMNLMTGAYGLGWAISEASGECAIMHAGSFDGYYCAVVFWPASRAGIIVMTNSTGDTIENGVKTLVKKIPTIAFGPDTSLVESEEVNPLSEAADVDTNNEDTTYAPPIDINDLMRHVIDAAGGELILSSHKSLSQNRNIDLVNQGIHCDESLCYEVPHNLDTKSIYYVGTKPVATQEVHFDGINLHEEFANGDYNIASSRTGNPANVTIQTPFHDIVDWKSLFPSVKIVREDEVNTEPVYVIEKTREKGEVVTDFVSKTTFRILKRHDPALGGYCTYSDFRWVDEQLMPFEWTLTTPTETFQYKVTECSFL